MNYYKPIAILFTLFTFSAFRETYRILTSSDKDIVANRYELAPMALIISGVFLWATIRFWQKSKRRPLR